MEYCRCFFSPSIRGSRDSEIFWLNIRGRQDNPFLEYHRVYCAVTADFLCQQTAWSKACHDQKNGKILCYKQVVLRDLKRQCSLMQSNKNAFVQEFSQLDKWRKNNTQLLLVQLPTNIYEFIRIDNPWYTVESWLFEPSTFETPDSSILPLDLLWSDFYLRFLELNQVQFFWRFEKAVFHCTLQKTMASSRSGIVWRQNRAAEPL